jgi:hypothetical protein
MKYDYLFKEFGPEEDMENIQAFLRKCGQEEWEAVNVSPMLHMVGGVSGMLSVPAVPRLGYTFLMKRPAK